MSSIEETIDVAVAPDQAYALWADFGRYSAFVEGVERVERHGDTLHWVAKAALSTNTWDAEITAEEPGRRIAWKAAEGPIDTEIIFEPGPEGGTRVIFREQMHDSLLARAAAASGYAGRRARDDLDRYKALVEAGS